MEEKEENKVFLGVFTCNQNKEGLREVEKGGGASSQPPTGVYNSCQCLGRTDMLCTWILDLAGVLLDLLR